MLRFTAKTKKRMIIVLVIIVSIVVVKVCWVSCSTIGHGTYEGEKKERQSLVALQHLAVAGGALSGLAAPYNSDRRHGQHGDDGQDLDAQKQREQQLRTVYCDEPSEDQGSAGPAQRTYAPRPSVIDRKSRVDVLDHDRVEKAVVGLLGRIRQHEQQGDQGDGGPCEMEDCDEYEGNDAYRDGYLLQRDLRMPVAEVGNEELQEDGRDRGHRDRDADHSVAHASA